MEIIETPIFTKRITSIIDDDDYRSLQSELVKNPEIGELTKEQLKTLVKHIKAV